MSGLLGWGSSSSVPLCPAPLTVHTQDSSALFACGSCSLSWVAGTSSWPDEVDMVSLIETLISVSRHELELPVDPHSPESWESCLPSGQHPE